MAINLPHKTIVNGDAATTPVGASLIGPLYDAAEVLSDAWDAGILGQLLTFGNIKMKVINTTTPTAQGDSVNIAHGVNPDKIIFVFGKATIDLSQHFYLWSDNVSSLYGDGNRFSVFVVGDNLSIQTSPANSGSVLSKTLNCFVLYYE